MGAGGRDFHDFNMVFREDVSVDVVAVSIVVANVGSINGRATVVLAASPVTLAPGPPIAGARVLVIEDGPTVTHGGMPFGAGTVAARQEGAVIVDPRPYAVGSLADTFRAYPGIGAVLPAMGYSPAQVEDLRRTVEACPCDVIVSGTPVDLGRILVLPRPLRRASYTLEPAGDPTLADALAPFVAAVSGS